MMGKVFNVIIFVIDDLKIVILRIFDIFIILWWKVLELYLDFV